MSASTTRRGTKNVRLTIVTGSILSVACLFLWMLSIVNRLPKNTGSSGLLRSPLFDSGRPRIFQAVVTGPLVSIVTPFMNVDPVVFQDTVHCVTNSTFENWEWVIVDDSSDDPASIAAMEAARDANPQHVRIVQAKEFLMTLDPESLGTTGHVGLGNARKIGLEAAQAPYVLFLDGDDVIDPTAPEKFMWYLHTHPNAHFVSSYVLGFGAQTYAWTRGFHPSSNMLQRNDAVSIAMHRKASLMRVGHSTRRAGLEDWDTWLRYANEGLWGGIIPEFLIYYRRRMRHDDRWEALDENAMQAFKESIPKVYPHLSNISHWPPTPQVDASTYDVSLPTIVPLGMVQYDGRPRVLLLVPWLVMGGADRFNLDLLRGLHARHWHVSIVTTLFSNNIWQDHFRDVTDDLFFLPNVMPAINYLEAVHSMIISRQIDVVWISNSFYGYAMLPYLTAAHPSVVFVDYNHMEEENWRRGGHPRSTVAMQSLLDHSYVSSHHLKKWMADQGADLARIMVEYTSVNRALWQNNDGIRAASRVRRDLPKDAFVILYACRIDAQKQPLLFAATVQQLLTEGDALASHTHVVIAGAGPLEADTRKQLESIPAAFQSNIHWLGALTPPDVKNVLQASDVLFLPSEMEGIPLTYFEAMALGVVVVGADVGGVAELVVHNSTGFLLNPSQLPVETRFQQSVDIYASYLNTLRRQPEVWKRLSDASLDRVVQFEQYNMLNRVHYQLLSLMATRKEHPRRAQAVDGGTLAIAAETYRWAVRGETGESSLHPAFPV
jgi:glycosyltransferase involved in cell wall biosynthesis